MLELLIRDEYNSSYKYIQINKWTYRLNMYVLRSFGRSGTASDCMRVFVDSTALVEIIFHISPKEDKVSRFWRDGLIRTVIAILNMLWLMPSRSTLAVRKLSLYDAVLCLLSLTYIIPLLRLGIRLVGVSCYFMSQLRCM